MREKLLELKKSIDTSKKTKKLIGIVALFTVALFASVYLASYSHYVRDDSNLIMEGKIKIEGSDVTLKIFMQNRDASGNPSSDYTRVYFIPQSEYTYVPDKTKCTSGVNIDSFTDNKFNITASRKGSCEVYFNADASGVINGNPNVTMKIMAEQTKGKGDYVEVGALPHEYYEINEAKTSETCTNVSLTGTTINVVTSGDAMCVVYADLTVDEVVSGDVALRVYRQNVDNNGAPLEAYSRIYYIPQSGYTFNSSKTKCTDGITVDGYAGGKLNVTAGAEGVCDVYFDADPAAALTSTENAGMRIFIEQTKGQQDYIEVGKVPSTNYVINTEKTGKTCSNVTLSGTTLNVTSSSDFACKVYLDLK